MITTQPRGQTVQIGFTATFFVAATGTLPLRYQWRFNNADLAGATNQSLIITNVQPVHAGTYSVRVTNIAGSVTSAPAVLRVPNPPRITTQPKPQTAPVGGTATFNVDATGALPLQYQWFFNIRDLPGATNATLVLNNVQLTNAGNYSVQVSNVDGRVLSSPARLDVTVPAALRPFITSQPQSQTVIAGATVTFSVSVVGLAPLIYQWTFNGTNIPAATNAMLVLTNARSAFAGAYAVRVRNAGGVADSAVARLTVIGPPAITGQPQDQTVAAGTNVTFVVAVASTVPLKYQWLFNGREIAGATNVLLKLTKVQASDAGNYSVRVSNVAGTVTSQAARLTVNPLPVLTGQPQSQAVNAGATVSFRVTATGTPPLRYQWLFEGREIAGATNAVFSVTNVQLANAGTYTARVRDAVGEVLSAAVVLKVSVPVAPPAITRQPESLSVPRGGTAIFGVQASGTPPLLYQWRFQDRDLAGATNRLLILTNLQPANAGNYSVRVGNAGGSVTSSAARLSVSSPPVITAQPQLQTVNLGATATFTVNAAGDGPFRYQWLFDGMEVPGATNATLVIRDVQSTHVGGYRVRVSNATGSVTSSEARLSTPPVITRQPQNVTAPLGAAVTFVVQAGGAPPLLYQWRFEGRDLPGATNAFLSLTDIRLANVGRYSVRVSNVAGSVTSEEARLSLSPPPTITEPPRDQTVNAGGTAIFAVSAAGEGLLRYQWRFNGSDLPGATNANLIITGVQSAHVGNYSVRVSNAAGSVTSSAARLSLAPQSVPPTIIRQPQNVTVSVGGRAVLSVQAAGTLPLRYQWRLNGQDLGGATNVLLVLTNAQVADSGRYSVRVSNSAGAVNSSEAQVAVNPPSAPPVISTQPQSRVVKAGETVVFTFVATGTPPFQYQWRFEGKNLLGATNSTLILKKVNSANVGRYSVRISNAGGSVISSAADLGVTSPPLIGLQPQSQTVLRGATVTLRVTATGTEPLRYQWRVNGRDLPGATNNVLVLTNAQVENAGSYSVRVSNATGAATSSEAKVAVNTPPTIISQPQDRMVLLTGTPVFNVGAVGTAPLRYQWRFNGRDLPGATNSLLLVARAQTTNAGNYSVRVANAFGAVTSDEARLAVTASPRIVRQPQDQNIVRGAAASFSVGVEGTEPFEYQWRFNGRDLPGATNAVLVLTNAQLTNMGKYAVSIRNAAGLATSQSAMLLLNIPPLITKQPESQAVKPGSGAAFFVSAGGTLPFRYQWRFSGREIPGATDATLLLTNVQAGNAGTYNVEVRNTGGSATSADARLTLKAPPLIQAHPANQTVPPGASVTFTVTALGEPPLRYQWLKNGAVILSPNAQSASFTIPDVQFSDSGAYSVVVANRSGAETSRKAVLAVTMTRLALADHFTNAPMTAAESDSFEGGDNRSATREPGEPAHAGRRGGKSVWFAWQAPASGIANFSTTGSDFDTLLAVYTGNRVDSLAGVASDDDRGAFKASAVTFNAVAGTVYRIAIDGDAGASGRIVISWRLQPTPQRIPRITGHPIRQTVRAGTDVTFSVGVESGQPFVYQWFFNSSAIPGANATNFVIRNAQASNSGQYTVKVSGDSSGQFVALTVESLPATLQINAGDPEPQKVAANDKFLDLLDLTAPGSVGLLSWPGRAGGSKQQSVARGYSGSQVFSTFGASKDDGEPNHCDEIGGASQWFLYQPPTNGVLRVSTEGSEFDTVLAVYTGPGTDFETLNLEACNDNATTNAQHSLLTLPVVGGTNYYIAVDGVDGAQGQVELGYDLGSAPRIATQPASQSASAGTNVTLSVEAVNPLASAPFSYQWQREGSELAEATNAILVLNNVQPIDAGNYAVIVTSSFGSATSAVATVTVSVPVAITEPPQDQTASAGASALFSVAANGTEPLAYQWFFEETMRPGETNATLVLPIVQPSDAGNYHVVITNPAGSVASPPATLTVGVPPQIISQPQNTNALVGATVTLAVGASGTEPLNFRWRFEDQEIAGATNSNLVLANLPPSRGGEYTVTVSNANGSVVSDVAVLQVNVPVTILSDPQSQTVAPGTTATFASTAMGTAPLSYQWQFNGVDIPAATNATFAALSVQAENAGSYRVLVSNAFSSEASEEAELVLVGGTSVSLSYDSAFIDGAFVVRLIGLPNETVELQASIDMLTWETVATLTLTGELIEYRDAQARNFNHRFYRGVIRE
ncbi:MAG: immunoglobulin domain-containing protein [Verrucomicrobia bacterium]|nr:immunoglobulin domain-containing protein [Verrucomicrobiota bacterium]